MSVCNISAKLGARSPVGCTIEINDVCSNDLSIVVNVALEILKRKISAGATSIIKIVSNGNPMVYRFVALDSSSILVQTISPSTNVFRNADLTNSYIRVVNNIYSVVLNICVSTTTYICFQESASASLMRYRLLSVGDNAMDLFDFLDIDQLALGQCDIVEVM